MGSFGGSGGNFKKNRLLLTSVHIEKDSLRKIANLVDQTEGENQSRIIRRAIKEYLEKNYKGE